MTAEHPLARRRAGILLHPTSLPASRRQGALGDQARRFIDLLAATGQTVWQVLPLGPTHEDGSPYQALSVHAGNTCLISIDELIRRDWLQEEDVNAVREQHHDDGPGAEHQALLASAWRRFAAAAQPQERQALQEFCAAHPWLEDYALYRALRLEQHGQPWYAWPAPLRDRQAAALVAARTRLHDEIERIRFQQFVFFDQWQALKRYANDRGVLVFGDIPIFVAHDSVDVWCHQDMFALDEEGMPTVVAGVPPDYFSATGQRWGNPLYRWDRMAERQFDWWRERLRSQLALVDVLRIDHFRGFESYWEIPADQDTAMGGQWRPGPGGAFFEILRQEFPSLPLVAEDLGFITPEVHQLRDRFALPGMKILQFAFDGSADNPYLPHNHVRNGVVYTGTHDNDTTLGWFDSLPEDMRQRVMEYLGCPDEAMPWPLIRSALASVADLAIVPFQDVLELGSTHRMNMPGTLAGNWVWQFDWAWLGEQQQERLARLTRLYGRD